MKKYKHIVLCTADPIKNAGNLREYFISNSEIFVTFHFPQGYSKDFSYTEEFRNGELINKRVFSEYKGNNFILKNIFYFICFTYTLLFYAPRKSFVITNAPVYCTFSSLSTFIKSDRFVLWIGDYYPQKSIFIWFYHQLVNFYNYNLKYVLYLSPPLENIYKKKSKTGTFREIISLGIKRERIPVLKRNKKITVGFIGVIRMQQGLDLFFSYLKEENNCVLEVVGDGYHLPYYKKLAKKYGISKKVKFYGRVENVTEIFAKWDMGIALYEDRPDNLSLYCEPTKIKQYLSFGLPVITTRTTYFNNEVALYSAGIVIKEDIKSLKNAVYEIDKNRAKYLRGVEKLVNKYEYAAWYDNHFSFLEK